MIILEQNAKIEGFPIMLLLLISEGSLGNNFTLLAFSYRLELLIASSRNSSIKP
jgi:hypothetical protein